MGWFAITPGRGDGDRILARLPALRAAGVTRLLLREKALTAAARRRLAGRIAPACRDLGVECWISEDWETGRDLGLGVHLSERSSPPREVARRAPGLALGLSLHADSARTAADVAACRHAFLSPVFPVAKAPQRPALGVAGFQRRARDLPLPVYALGGVLEEQARLLWRAGVRNLAGIRLFFDPVDPHEVQEVLARIQGSAS